jgi:hypothetical protein
MSKISEVLIKSKKKQIAGSLVKHRDEKTGLPLDYCALGVLACEKGMLDKIGSEDDIGFKDIINSYGVSSETMVKIPRKSLLDKGCYYGQQYKIIIAIFKLNDQYKWSFKQIGKWIKKLEKQGVIKYGL